MRRLLLVSAVLLATACSGKDSTQPCVLKLDVQDIANVQINSVGTIRTEVGRKSGNCSSIPKVSLTWNNANPAVLTLQTTTDTLAVAKGVKAGTAIITAWFTQQPSIRDSTLVTVVAPTDQ